MDDLAAGLADVAADRRPHLDDRLVELGLEQAAILLEQVVDVGAQVPAHRIDEWNSSSIPRVNHFESAGELATMRSFPRCRPYADANRWWATALATYSPQVRLSWPGIWAWARRIAMLAAASTIQSKLASPIDSTSASGAGLQKSMA